MKYIQIKFSDLVEEQSDILIALLADIGFEGFEENENELKAFIAEKQSYERFTHEWIVQDGIMRRLHTLAESTQHIPELYKNEHPEIDWNAIKGLRNTLVHEYLGNVDPDTVWRSVVEHLPHLKKVTLALLEKHYGR